MPVNVTASSRFSTGEQFSPSNLADAEYTGADELTSASDIAALPFAGDGNWFWCSNWISTLPADGVRVTVTLDFGSDVEMDNFVLWNYVSDQKYAADFNRGIKDFSLSFATEMEGESGFNTSISDTGMYTAALTEVDMIDDAPLPDAERYGGTTGQVFDFADVTARYVRVNMYSNHGSTQFFGACEMRVSAVPEPSTVIMLVSGLAGLGLMVWRRKK